MSLLIGLCHFRVNTCLTLVLVIDNKYSHCVFQTEHLNGLDPQTLVFVKAEL